MFLMLGTRADCAVSAVTKWRILSGRVSAVGLANYLVGERNQSRWNGEAKSLGGLEIDCELEFGRLENWQIGRLGAPQDLSNIVVSLPIGVRDVGMVAQSEGF